MYEYYGKYEYYYEALNFFFCYVHLFYFYLFLIFAILPNMCTINNIRQGRSNNNYE